ncbi:diaminopimelate epimerase [Stakelama sediminis]|uniref:Diaminopimelate epimerase n=2 Tax=Stakelama sediminis TaxID=463200 RepID=A0A840Z1F2_9SPHN|nr:diaminopimelate epimerase [Stakelama sediminis]
MSWHSRARVQSVSVVHPQFDGASRGGFPYMGGMRLDFIKCHGSGNDFPLIDARFLTLDDGQWAAVARLMADRDGPVGGDGLLLLVPGDATHAFGMRMFNSDGSEAETCLNGLRCTARLGFEVTGLDHAPVKLKTSSAQAALAEAISPGVATIRTRAGPASTACADVGLVGVGERIVDAVIPGLPSERHFTGVAMPNPHLVTFVDAVDEAELVALGDWCEAGPALIPARANVSFVELRAGGLFVRTYERGVGLTDSCGSAMAASTYAAGLTGRTAFGAEVNVFNRGGLVRATAQADGMVEISGNATFDYDAHVEIDPDAGTIGAVAMVEERGKESAAWKAAVEALA